jgi:hypothetical protein
VKNIEQLWNGQAEGRAHRASIAASIVVGLALVAPVRAQLVLASDVKTQAEHIVKTPAGVPAPMTVDSIPARSTRTAERVPHVEPTTVAWSSGPDGAAWVRGAGFKARFGDDGVTVIPFLGGRAERSHPAKLTLAGLISGGQSLAFDELAPAVRDGERVTFHRGIVDEVYDVQLDGIEQSFVVQEMSHDAALSLFVAVDSDLSPRERANGLELASAQGGLRYGRAVVIDANGARAAAPTHLVEGGIAIDVPAAFLADAAFPVTVDPLITSFVIDGDSNDDFAPDTSYDAGSHHFVTVYEQVFSATDHDVRFVVTDESGGFVSAGTIDITSTDWRNPKIANNRIMGEFLVVAESGAAPNRIVEGRILSAAALTTGPYLTLSGNELGDKLAPDVGGDSALLGPTYFLVAYERVYSATDTDIHANLIDFSGGIAFPGLILVDNSFDTLDRFVSVSPATGNGTPGLRDWTIVWQREYSTNDQDIRGAQIHWDGAITTPSFSIDNSVSNDWVPSVSTVLNGTSGPLRYAVAFERHDANGDADIQVDVLAGGAVQLGVDLNVLEGASPLAEQILPLVESDGSQFAVLYSETNALGNPDYDVHLSTVYASGSTMGLSESGLLVTNANLAELGGTICSCASSGGQAGRFMLGWSKQFGFTRDVYASLYSAPAGLPGSTYCYGTAAMCPCGNGGAVNNGCANSVTGFGAYLAFAGAASVSGDSVVLESVGMPLGGACLFFQGTGETNIPFGDGLRCVTGAILRLGVKINVTSTVHYPTAGDPKVSVQGLVPEIGGKRYYQNWYRDAADNFCTSATFNLTNGLLLTWVP